MLDANARPVSSVVKVTSQGREVSFVAQTPGLGYAFYYLASDKAGKATRQPKQGHGKRGNTIENEF